ncbi:MAG: hypothetical protein LBO69_01030 [Ignavibacteria bacterium]|jgi:hypothetical protein|nr:hypothetical protein [Ignavibacteria bacterium]
MKYIRKTIPIILYILLTTAAHNTCLSAEDDFIFTSPRPLITTDKQANIYNNTSGLDLMLSTSGIGFGIFYDYAITSDYKFISSVFYSGVKNTDEIEYLFDYNQYDYIVYGKVRRLYDIGINAGIQRYINIEHLSKSFRPYFAFLITPTLIWEMPYISDWFSDVKYSKAHFRFGGGVQVGAEFGAVNTSQINVKMRYTYVPFGGDGLESVADSPIHNFGGFYLMLSIGGMW